MKIPVARWAAGRSNHFPRKPDRAHPDDLERARRDALWDSLSRALPVVIWHTRRKHSRPDACARGLRLVWRSNVDRRQRGFQNPSGVFSKNDRSCSAICARNFASAARLLSLFLNDQYVGRLARD